jgi:phage I-like protein
VKPTPTHFFTVDLDKQSMKFDDGDVRKWIQGLPLGTYEHPVHGRISITTKRVANFVRNFYDRVRDTDLDVDYEHKEFTSKAAGWIVDVEDRGPDGLWLCIEWTPEAIKSLRDREYRYFSPEFADKWKHPKSGVIFNDVLFGGALTNRPFLKDILPINLSEFGHVPSQGEKQMDKLLKALSELLGVQLSDDEDTAVAEVSSAIAQLKEPKKSEGDPGQDEALKQLAESNPVVAKLLAENQGLKEAQEQNQRDILELKARNRLSEVQAMFMALNSEEFAIAPAARDRLTKVAIKLSDSDASEFVSAIQDLMKDGIVRLGEVGQSRRSNGDADRVKQFHETVEKFQTEHKLSYADAVQRVIETDVSLFDAYNDQQLAETKRGRN